jgi:hypothetical protein
VNTKVGRKYRGLWRKSKKEEEPTPEKSSFWKKIGTLARKAN